jgi:hypothetical protein
MPPRFAYWTILIDDKPTAFRAREQQELLPTFTQLKRTNGNVAMKWFAQGRLWDSPEAQRAARQAPPPVDREKRGGDWRPGGAHKDPRDRFKKRNRPERAWSDRDPSIARDRDKPGPPPGPRQWRDKPSGAPPGRPPGDRPWSGKPRARSKPWTGKPRVPSKPWTAKPRDPSKPWTAKPRDPSKPWTGKPRDPSKPWTAKPRDPSKPWTAKPRDPSKPWTAKPQGASKPWRERPNEQRKPFRPRGSKPDAPSGDNAARKRNDEEQ